MKIFRHLQYVFGVLLLSATMAFTGINSVYADDIPEYRIQLSPAKQDIGELKPGETFSGSFKVQNTGSKSFSFKVGVYPYTVSDENYAANYDVSNSYTDIAKWVTFSQQSGSVEPNSEVEIKFTVKVPSDAPAGGQYAILAAETTGDEAPEGSSGIVAVRRVGMLLYSNVAGTTHRTGKVVENNVAGILFNPPISATSIVENTGNVHANVKYVLQVYPLFSDEEVYTNEENPDILTVLPETRRFNTVTWAGSPRLGIFRVRQTITVFDQTSVTEKLVVLCPIWFLFIILVIIFCAIAWIVMRVRGRNQK